MPGNVKTPRDEHLWTKAKSIARKEYPDVTEDSDNYYAIVMGIYKKMKGVKKSIFLLKGRKLHYRTEFQGLPISIENRKGSIRRGEDATGEWETKMKNAYGYIRGTVGADSDQLDCFIGPDKDSEKVFVIHIKKPENGKYDEDKVFLGFETFKAAMIAFKKHYDDWQKYYQGFDVMDMETFKDRIEKKGKKIEKSQVKAYQRVSATGKVVPVKSYQNRKTKKPMSLTETPEFKKWFGNSKVVDANGKPSMVYHGTSTPFNIFKDFKHGIHFTDNEATAKEYATGIDKNLSKNKNSKECKNLEREIEFIKEQLSKVYEKNRSLPKGQPNDESFWTFEHKIQELEAEKLNLLGFNKNKLIKKVYLSMQNPSIYDAGGEKVSLIQINTLVRDRRSKGYDGLIIKDIEHGKVGNYETHYIVFSPAQIKSATGNRGTFDPKNPDITKSIRYFIKSHVKGHTRTTQTGKVVPVRDYENRKTKIPDHIANHSKAKQWYLKNNMESAYLAYWKDCQFMKQKCPKKKEWIEWAHKTWGGWQSASEIIKNDAIDAGDLVVKIAKQSNKELTQRMLMIAISNSISKHFKSYSDAKKWTEDFISAIIKLKKLKGRIKKSIRYYIRKSFSSAMESKYPGGKWITITNESSPLHGRHIFIVPHKDGTATIAWAPGQSGLTHKVLRAKKAGNDKPAEEKHKAKKELPELSEEEREKATTHKQEIETAQKQATEELHSKIREKLGIQTAVTKEEKANIDREVSKIADKKERNIERLKQFNKIRNERDKAIDEVIGEAKKAMLGEVDPNLTDEKKSLREVIKDNAEEFLKYHYQIKAYMREKKVVSDILKNKTKYRGGSDVVEIKPMNADEIKQVLSDEKVLETEIGDHYRLIINTRGGIGKGGEEIRGSGTGSETIMQNITKGGFEAMTGITGEASGNSILDMDTYRVLGSNNSAILMNYYLENSMGTEKYAGEMGKLKKYIQDHGQKIASSSMENGDKYLDRAQRVKGFGRGEDALFGDRVQANATALQYIQRAYESYGQAEGSLNQAAELMYQFDNKKRNMEFASGSRAKLNSIREKLHLHKSDADIQMLDDGSYKMTIRPVEFERIIKERPISTQQTVGELSAADIKSGKANTNDYLPEGLKPYMTPDRNGVAEKVVLGFHQQAAARLVVKEKRVYLNFEAGTGKSASYLASIAAVKEKTGKTPKTIISMPKKLMPNFSDEIRKFSDFNVVIVDSSDKKARQKLYNSDPDTIVLVNKEKYLFDNDMIKNAGFDMMIVDEAHRSGQREGRGESGMSKGLADLAGNMEYFIAGSGTPTPNDLSELYFYLKTIDPEKYSNQKTFMEKYKNLHRGAGMKDMLTEIMHKEIDDRVFTVKKDLQHTFKQHVHNAELSDTQRVQYKKVMSDYQAKKIDVLDRDQRLNRILNSTRFEDNQKFAKMGEIIDNHIKTKGEDEKVIIYAQQYKTVGEIERYLKAKYPDAGVVKFDGRTKLEDIDSNKKSFRSDKKVRFAIHTDAGTEGLNLQYTGKPGEMGATTAIAMASGANSYSVINQFFSRANRMRVPKEMTVDGHLVLTNTPHDIRTEMRLEDKKAIMSLIDNAKTNDDLGLMKSKRIVFII